MSAVKVALGVCASCDHPMPGHGPFGCGYVVHSFYEARGAYTPANCPCLVGSSEAAERPQTHDLVVAIARICREWDKDERDEGLGFAIVAAAIDAGLYDGAHGWKDGVARALAAVDA